MKKKILGIALIVILLGYVAVCQIPKYRFGYFVNGPKMNVPRAYHQSILLNDEEILLTGGIDISDTEKNGISTAEIYSINENFFKQVNNTNLPHLYHKMFKTTDGNIVIADINGIEIYDNKDKSFHLLNTKFENRYPEFSNYKFVLLPEDKLLIIGGRYQYLSDGFGTGLKNKNSGEIIDIKNDKTIKKFNIQGNGFGTILLPDGNLLILGGKIVNKKGEYLSDKIYIFNTKTYTLNLWGHLPNGIFNPFVFITSNNSIIVIGGEIQDYNKCIQGFNYMYTKGSPFVYEINLQDNNIKTIDISENLQNKKTFENFILDVVQYSNNLYFLQLKANNRFNSVIFDINSNKFKNLGNIFVLSAMRYRSNNVKFANGILMSGGKMFYQEPTEYSINSKQIPFARETFNAEAEGYVLDDTIILKIKENNYDK